ncbi:hypothetical protein VO63_09555 [Streptomyces showdoensis]|uniref:Uncharacterized protein n=2 Tax=Streptomyces showdoensis TaxID=68268 RepID=A0A2P2GRH9_STREW|nr:hypothetical protein VO63_09555 [Streptomyces showdoensis]
MTQGALVVGSIGVLINIVDAIGSGRPEPHHAFAAVVALGAGGELLKERRPRAARALYAVAAVLVVVAGSVAGTTATGALLRGDDFDLIDLGLGVLTVFYVATCAGRLVAYLSRRASRSRDVSAC